MGKRIIVVVFVALVMLVGVLTSRLAARLAPSLGAGSPTTRSSLP